MVAAAATDQLRPRSDAEGIDAMRMCILILGALLAGLGGVGGLVFAQAPAPLTNAGPVQPWGLPPLPQGVGPVEKFADIGNTPQGKFLEGGAFDEQGNLWFVAIG